ncbi:hypothetical protein GCM10009117_13130 [Gangjinia marincola]|uniref:Glycosyl hydrolase family 13 catalytic domain-containing protein n=1 Tax=Gangjinia marincola TaxID=578463 RepID=A0ABP3XVZ2_9FLAO
MRPASLLSVLFVLFLSSCNSDKKEAKPNTETAEVNTPFTWENLNLYFLLTDRFHNGDPSNDVNFNRTKEAAKLRGFEGGDFAGIIQKIEEGYFDKLGINALWFSPVAEQIHDATDEGTGVTYGFHGYWANDWTSIEPNFGTAEELQQVVNTAHDHGIKVLFDVVLNHTGPVTDADPYWGEAWARTSPGCSYQNQETAVTCTLVENLPDIKTESDEEVELPQALIDKWTAENRLEEELAELEEFFDETGLKRTPTNYFVKWLTDYITDYGIDGFRIDTVKHVEEDVWQTLAEYAEKTFATYKSNHPEEDFLSDHFYMVGELYGYTATNGRAFNFGDKKVDYFDHGFDDMINFQFKYDAQKPYDSLFTQYATLLNEGELKEVNILNYLSSHDDGQPFDPKREKSMEAATKLMLSPGGAQLYYGDETNRSLVIEGTVGDATLRSMMNWEDIEKNQETKKLLAHYQKLGQFRKQHPAIAAGTHKLVTVEPYYFERSYTKEGVDDHVVVGLDLAKGKKKIPAPGFEPRSEVRDAYSGKTGKVVYGTVELDTPYTVVLLEKLE